jgi:hypothetical protein
MGREDLPLLVAPTPSAVSEGSFRKHLAIGPTYSSQPRIRVSLEVSLETNGNFLVFPKKEFRGQTHRAILTEKYLFEAKVQKKK